MGVTTDVAVATKEALARDGAESALPRLPRVVRGHDLNVLVVVDCLHELGLCCSKKDRVIRASTLQLNRKLEVAEEPRNKW